MRRFTELAAAGMITATSLLTSTQAEEQPPALLPLPPKLTANKDSDRPFILMARMLDIFKDDYKKKLGMEGAHRVQASCAGGEISEEITDAKDVKSYCKECDVDDKKVEKVTVTGSKAQQFITFVGPNDETYATTVTQKYKGSTRERPPEQSDTGILASTHFITQNRVMFTYAQDSFMAAEDTVAPKNSIDLRYDGSKQTITATTKGMEGTPPPKVYTVKQIEELSRQLAAKSAADKSR